MMGILMRFGMIVLIVAVLAGCVIIPPGVGMTGLGYGKAGGSWTEQAEAESACGREVNATGGKTFDNCMARRGWSVTPTHWYRVGGSPDTWTADAQSCLATTSTASLPPSINPAVGSGLILARCLEEKGWTFRASKP